MRDFTGKGLTACLVVCLGVSGFATQLPVRIYTTADGLARDAVNCIVPDSRGFLWFCTAEGLSRFDGYGFVNYGPAQGLPHRTVNAFLQTRQGIYLAATDDGLARLDPAAPLGSPRKFVSLGVPGTVFALLEDRLGNVWAGVPDGLYRIENPGGPHPQPHWEGAGFPSAWAVRSLAEDGSGNIWAGTSGGLCRRAPDGGVACFDSSPGGPPHDTVNALCIDRDGRLWAATLSGLWRIAIDGASPRLERVYGVADGLASARVHSIFQSAGGTLWVGTAAALSERIGERFRNYAAGEGLSGRAVLALNEDRDGNLWAGVDHGLARIARDGFATFTAAEGMGSRSITELLESGGDLYAVSNETSSVLLHRYAGEVFTSVRPLYPRGIRYFGWASGQSALRDRAGEWWIATGQGVCRFPRVAAFEQLAHTPPKAVYTMHDGLPANDIFRLFEDSRGDIWITTIGNSGGPSRWERATGRLHHYTQDDVPGYASAYAEDRAGNLWIGFSNDVNTGKPCGLVRYRDGRFERYSASGAGPAGWISALFVDRAGRLWVASGDSGLGRIDDPTAASPRFVTYTTAQGLSSVAVRRIGEDRMGRIYAGTARGLDRLDLASGNFKHYSTADGLANGMISSIHQDRQGVMWFGATMGLSRMAPAPATTVAAPAVYITGLNINGEPRAVADPGVERLAGLRLQPGQRQMHIEFAGLGEGLQYEYKLDGADARWSGPSSPRSVNYASLSPGKYRFLVRAVTTGGVASVAPAEVAFQILPPLWRQWWFVSLAAAALALMVHGAHRYHLARQIELERVRARIATDLHDDLGASLSRVAILSEIVNRQAGLAQSEPGQRLAEIAETARGLVDGMSDIVWSIDPRRDDMRSLLRRIRQSAGEMLEPRAIAWSLDAPPELEGLAMSPDQRRNVFLMVKEAVHNAARHARCSRVTVTIGVRDGECSVEVRDDGRGLPEPEPENGNGLANMRTRAKALGGAFEIARASGGGTEVRLRFPIARAHKYALPRGWWNGG
jgi:ligand-binding sensor domain-containing protein/two-component sensor histidine kinase